MADKGTKFEKDLTSLRSTVATFFSLIAQLLDAIKADEASEASPTKDKNEINALDLAHDAAMLIKAHSTKISLLIINTPFTPTAVTSILREVSSGPLPALARAVELCDPGIYTATMRSELQWRVENVLREFGALGREIPLDGKVLSTERKNGTAAGKGKGSLASTGVLWEACDAVLEIKNLGIAGLMIQKAEQYRDTLQDALEELQEWGDEESDTDDGEFEASNGHAHEQDVAVDQDNREDSGDDDDITTHTKQEALDALFPTQRHIPPADADLDQIRPRLNLTLRRLKLTLLLYRALIKHRLKTLPSTSTIPTPIPLNNSTPTLRPITRLTTLLPQLASLPDAVDELASAFYSLSPAVIDAQMAICVGIAVAVAEGMALGWGGERDDAFTRWAGIFVQRMSGSESEGEVVT